MLKSSNKELDALYDFMNASPTMKIEIAGHTDFEGSPSSNLKLSEQRANAVKEYLVSKGIKSNRIKAVGYGGEHPVTRDLNGDAREKNMRVELKILKL